MQFIFESSTTPSSFLMLEFRVSNKYFIIVIILEQVIITYVATYLVAGKLFQCYSVRREDRKGANPDGLPVQTLRSPRALFC